MERLKQYGRPLLEYRVGSHLYGTNTADSDEDFCGVFVAHPQFYLGLRSVEEVDLSVVSKDESGKNTKDAVDRKFFELRKFVRLALENNPNVLEQLFVNFDDLVYGTTLGRTLLNVRQLFPHRGLRQKFVGYALSQRHKMVEKVENHDALNEAARFLQSRVDLGQQLYQLGELGVGGTMPFPLDTSSTPYHFTVGSLKFQMHVTVKNALEKVRARLDKFGSRQELVSKHGYDTKFAMHLCRLLLEGEELLVTGDLKFPLRSAPFLRLVREGKYTVEEVMTFADNMEDRLRRAEEKSPLPEKPRTEEVEKLLTDMVKMSWKEEEE